MKNKTVQISIFCMLMNFVPNVYGQEQNLFADNRCHVLTVKEKCWKDWDESTHTFGSLQDCIDFKNKYYTYPSGTWASENCQSAFLKDCQLCKSEIEKKKRNEQQSSNNTKPTNTNKPVSQDNSSLCASQRANIDLLKNKQSALGKDDAATYSMLNSAINQMKNVECGIVLKSADCQNKNCSFEWSTKESNVDDAKAKASVSRFYSELKKEVKEEADKNAQKAENIKMVIETVVAIAGLIDDYYQPKQSSNKFTKVDDDKDGKTDALVEQTANGGQNLYIDTDNDGVADRIAHIDKGGKATYERLDVSKNPISMNQTSATDKWESFYKSQTGKVGDDGYMTIVKPASKLSEKYDYNATEKTYLINGMQNNYDVAFESAQLLSNTVGQPVIQVYSAADGFVYDLNQAMNYRLNTNVGSPATDNLAKSITYDLLSDKKVTIYAHSRGAAGTYQITNNLSEAFKTAGIENKLQNLTIVTVGGYAPPASSWPKGITVETIKHPNDPVPTIGGNSVITEIPTIKYGHSFETYISEILDYNINRKKRK
jgi:hypothetical protein